MDRERSLADNTRRPGWAEQFLVALSVVMILLVSLPASAGAGSWSYYRLLTIDESKVPSDLSNFPVLVSLSGNWLKSSRLPHNSISMTESLA